MFELGEESFERHHFLHIQYKLSVGYVIRVVEMSEWFYPLILVFELPVRVTVYLQQLI